MVINSLAKFKAVLVKQRSEVSLSTLDVYIGAIICCTALAVLRLCMAHYFLLHIQFHEPILSNILEINEQGCSSLHVRVHQTRGNAELSVLL